jgi:flagellar protein FliT
MLHNGTSTMPSQLIDYYHAIEACSLKMLDAARAENWDQVVQYESTCAVLIEQLRQTARTQELQPEERTEKTKIMQRILSHDAQIRVLAEPWLSQLEFMAQRPVLLH